MLDLFTWFVILLILLVLLHYIIKFSKAIWLIILNLHVRIKKVDLRKKYGDWAVVTGSTDGIGKAYAIELVKKHINVVLISRSIEKLNSTKQELHGYNSLVQIEVIQADFSKGKEEIKKIESELKDIPVAILVNNVGKAPAYPMYLEEMSQNELWDTININIGAATLLTRIIIEQMKKQGKGAIVNISSATNLMPVPLMAVYSASKIFVKHFSDAIRAEYAKYGLTIQCLSPFYINTQMIGFSERLQNYQWFCPDPSTYAKHAIETLGKVDSTTGYWLHDIEKYFLTILPMCLRIKIVFFIKRVLRNEYFAMKKQSSD